MNADQATGQPVPVQILMTDADFDHLSHTAQEWARYSDDNIGGGWKGHIRAGRFILHAAPPGEWPALNWKWSYWGDNYANLILARSYLAARGHDYQVVWDEGGDGAWGILTDYETKALNR
jgi:hypothetical protein